jgi:hypothetical protein
MLLQLKVCDSLLALAEADVVVVLPADSTDLYDTRLTWSLNSSTEALISTLVLAIWTVSVPLILSVRRLLANSMMVGTNSAAISAQCHPPRQGSTELGDVRRDVGVEVLEVKEDEARHDDVREHHARVTSSPEENALIRIQTTEEK